MIVGLGFGGAVAMFVVTVYAGIVDDPRIALRFIMPFAMWEFICLAAFMVYDSRR